MSESKKMLGSEQNEIVKDLIAHDFAKSMAGVLEQEKIDAAVAKIKTASATIGGTMCVGSLIFYLRFGVKLDNGYNFTGDAGGLSTPGGGEFWGTLYTDDPDRLFSDTVSFSFQAYVAYTSLCFFDEHSDLLGHFQSGGVTTVSGLGGGSGKWKKG